MSTKDYYDIIVKPVIVATKSQIGSSEKGFFMLKIGTVIATYVFLTLNSLHDLMSPTYVPECVKDEVQELTLPINQYLAENPLARSALIIFASAMMDISLFAMSVKWLFFGKSCKTLISILAFYAFRAFIQSVFFMRFPTNYLWGNPGLFSIAVPYFPANDFFFSGHVGMCVMSYLEFKRAGAKFMKWFAFVSIIVEFFTLLVTRAHYFIDLVTGIIVAHYVYLCVEWSYEYFENKKKKNLEESQQIEKESQKETEKEAEKEKAKEEEQLSESTNSDSSGAGGKKRNKKGGAKKKKMRAC